VAALVIAALGVATARQHSEPVRIVSTSPSITETLFALGLGDRVVGVSTFCRYPPAAARLPKVGSFLKPEPETIAGLRPDLVIVHQVADGLDRRLSALHIPFVVVDRGGMPTIFSSIRQIAAATHVQARGEVLVSDIERRLSAMRLAAVKTSGPRVLFIIGRRPGALADLVAVGPD
jgi:iron complex transport system substrate-binding protein